MEGPISDDEFEIVEHPEEEPTAVEPPRPELPFCEEAVPCQIADEISETVSREIIKDTKKLGAPKVQLHGSVHVLLGVVMLMGVMRLVGALPATGSLFAVHTLIPLSVATAIPPLRCS